MKGLAKFLSDKVSGRRDQDDIGFSISDQLEGSETDIEAFERVKDRFSDIEGENIEQIYLEALENWNNYDESDNPRLKHGTSLSNVESIIEEGLKPGSENSSPTGESSLNDWVSFTSLFTTSLRYGQISHPEPDVFIAEAEKILSRDHNFNLDSPSGQKEFLREYTHNSEYDPDPRHQVAKSFRYDSGSPPAVIEVPLSSLDEISKLSGKSFGYKSIDTGDFNSAMFGEFIEIYEEDEEEIKSFLNEYDVPEDSILREAENNDKARSLVEFAYGEKESIETDLLLDYGWGDRLVTNELESDDALEEISVSKVELGEGSRIYVPHRRLEEYREKFDDEEVFIGSLEARCLVHEAKMSEEYKSEDKLSYQNPLNSGKFRFVNTHEEGISYNSDPTTIDVSNIFEGPVYENGESRLEALGKAS